MYYFTTKELAFDYFNAYLFIKINFPQKNKIDIYKEHIQFLYTILYSFSTVIWN